MKRTCGWLRSFVLLAGVAGLGHTALADGKSSYSVSLAGRYHAENAALPELPYGDGDWSAMIGLEAREGSAYWQLGVDLANGASRSSDVGYVATPQLNLLFADRLMLAGVGILSSYIQDDVQGDDWTDLYYQFTLGFEFPLGKKLRMTALSHYAFADWGELGDFDTEDLEYSLGMSYRF